MTTKELIAKMRGQVLVARHEIRKVCVGAEETPLSVVTLATIRCADEVLEGLGDALREEFEKHA